MTFSECITRIRALFPAGTDCYFECSVRWKKGEPGIFDYQANIWPQHQTILYETRSPQALYQKVLAHVDGDVSTIDEMDIERVKP